MLKTILTSFGMAFASIRSRFFHTLLSVLGIVIGVGALVAILSLIDGMEKYAHEQITKTTSLNAIMISSNSYERVNNVSIQKEDYGYFNYSSFQSLDAELDFPKKSFLQNRFNKNVSNENGTKKIASHCYFSNHHFRNEDKISKGRSMTKEEVDTRKPLAIVNQAFAQNLDSLNAEDIVGKNIVIEDSILLTVIGLVEEEDNKTPIVLVPFTFLSEKQIQENPPRLTIEADDVSDVPAMKLATNDWLTQHFGEKKSKDFSVIDNGFRLKQATQGIFIFRVIMGMIVGLSVLVGGIGVMNVLLISVTERTSEIGIRKALGASKRTIIAQFLSESIAVSIFGSFVGLLLGMGVASAAIPILNYFEEVPFNVTFTLNTLMTVMIISILIGIIFGTYPAIKAAKMDPVIAIQRE